MIFWYTSFLNSRIQCLWYLQPIHLCDTDPHSTHGSYEDEGQGVQALTSAAVSLVIWMFICSVPPCGWVVHTMAANALLPNISPSGEVAFEDQGYQQYKRAWGNSPCLLYLDWGGCPQKVSQQELVISAKDLEKDSRLLRGGSTDTRESIQELHYNEIFLEISHLYTLASTRNLSKNNLDRTNGVKMGAGNILVTIRWSMK